MGEEAKQEQPKAEAKPENKAEEKKEEKPSEEKKEEKSVEEKPVEEKKEEPKPPSPCVLFVDLHCVGCAKKIERSIMKVRGVEGVVIDMVKNEVTIKGIVEPQAICNTITKKTKRRTNVISPLPAAEGEPIPEVVNSQVSGPVTVELNVNMHCEACAQQLKRKILQMRGVQTAMTELSTGKVIVTGTMDANKLVEYVYRRTKKQAKIVPQPEPEPEKKEENKEAEEKPAAEEAKPEEKKEEEKPQEEAKKEEGNDEGGENEDKKNEEKGSEEKAEEETKKEENWFVVNNIDDEGMKRMMYYYPYQPLYMIERIPPPQLFSDENPNACCIS
ncbi:PREDICTED: heavy metal-associated isoprenylated plant protein 9-like isoform X2 [Lupinus angustifolius]|uniref:heavy metal-associated isoprenylated plant protein 9-like isoform X2 n=1 Tax=Lupinus angustifolius TaxID=3871 RepID=UPI00092F6D07|nr:PREDICTED: heavy metal-associated isoprenylated plant protein 9-like isoform X2 [Lupinus angustifolius]